MKKLISILLLLTIPFIIPVKVSADILPEGQKGVEYCFKIDNITNYPTYTFIAYPTFFGNDAYAIVKQDTCLKFYKLSTPKIYAVLSQNFNEKDILEKGEKSYFKDTTTLLPSRLEVHDYPNVDKNNPLDKVTDIATITSLTENSFQLKKSKIIYTYTDGRTEEKNYSDQNNQLGPSRKAFLPGWVSNFWYLTIPVFAILAMGTILIARKYKKR